MTDWSPIFKKGDAVMLKSGGPTMTVEFCCGIEPRLYRCVWTDARQDLWRAIFREDTLRMVGQ